MMEIRKQLIRRNKQRKKKPRNKQKLKRRRLAPGHPLQVAKQLVEVNKGPQLVLKDQLDSQVMVVKDPLRMLESDQIMKLLF